MKKALILVIGTTGTVGSEEVKQLIKEDQKGNPADLLHSRLIFVSCKNLT